MKKKTLLLFLLLASLEMFAVPALRLRKLITLEDGTQVMATLQGDEHYNFYVTDDGLIARYLPQSSKFRIVSDEEHTQAISIARSKVLSSNARRVASAVQRKTSFTGAKTGLVILAQFKDLKFTEGATLAYFNRSFNEVGFSEGGAIGSVHDYFCDQSYGQFNLTFDVVGPVTLPQDMAYYGGNDNSGSDLKPRDMAYDACVAAQDLADFSKYDWDNDGKVDQVFIIYAGYAEAQGGPKESIWPHEWVLYDKELYIDGKQIWTYGCSSELRGFTGENIDGIGTACHEFSHCLGLPDTYDTSYNAFGMGDWDVMSGGSYLGSPLSTSPIGYTSYQRWVSGWLTPIEISSHTTITDMSALEEKGEAYILYNDGKRSEYYMLENRQLPKWGSMLGAHGLMAMHIDYDADVWQQNSVNKDASHQRVTYVPADNKMSNSTYAGDPFPGTSNVTNLTNTTTPAARVYNKNTDGTKFLNKPIESIRETEDGKISFIACAPLVAAPTGLEAVIATGDKISCTWDEVAEAVGYDLELTAIPCNLSPEESIVMNETFANLPRTAGFVDIGNKLDKYCDNKGWVGNNIFQSAKGLKIGSAKANGKLYTPVYEVSRTNNVSILVKIQAYKSGDSVECTLYNVRKTSSGYEAVEKYIMNVGESRYFLINSHNPFTEPMELWFNDIPAPVCLESLVIYDGEFTFEGLGIETSSEVRNIKGSDTLLNTDNCDVTVVNPVVPQSKAAAVTLISKAQTTTIYSSSTHSYEFENLPGGFIYSIRVRAQLPDGRLTSWSDAFKIEISSGINSIGEDSRSIKSDEIYDLAGRRVNGSNLKSGIYVQGGHKVMKR